MLNTVHLYLQIRIQRLHVLTEDLQPAVLDREMLAHPLMVAAFATDFATQAETAVKTLNPSTAFLQVGKISLNLLLRLFMYFRMPCVARSMTCCTTKIKDIPHTR